MSAENSGAPLRYAVDESPPHLLAAGLGLQVVVLIIAGIVITPTVVLRAAGDPGGFLPWAVFAGLLVSGITTMIQARPLAHSFNLMTKTVGDRDAGAEFRRAARRGRSSTPKKSAEQGTSNWQITIFH